MFTQKKRLMAVRMSIFIAVFVVAPSLVIAAQPVPNVLNYQGKLTNPSTGQPIPNGAHTVTFRIYDAETNGALKGGPYLSHVTTQNGLFNADIGPIDPAVFDGSERWLELEVDGEILSPRQRIGSVPHALRAASGGGAGDGHSLDAADGDPTDAVFVDNDGKVGIGTTSPVGRLDVKANIASTQSLFRGFNNAGNTVIDIGKSGEYGIMYVLNNDSSKKLVMYAAPTGQFIGTWSNDDLSIATNGNEKIRVTTNGNVGIGTTDVRRRVSIISENTGASGLEIVAPSSHSSGVGTRITGIDFASNNYRSVNNSIVASIEAQNGDSNYNDRGQLAFKTGYTAGDGNPLYTRMVISFDGNVGIGTESPAYKLDVSGTIRGDNVNPSDVRLKQDITPIKNPLERVAQLRGMNYRWKDENRGRGVQMGVIAQEVEAIFPEVVSTDDQGLKSVAYHKLVAALIEAVKELKSENDALKHSQEQTNAELESLKARLNRLEAAMIHP